MPLYECIYMIKSAAPLTTVAHTMKNKAQVIFENGGVIRRLDNMGVMPLAYPMYRRREKHYKGRWVLMLFDASPEAVDQLRDRLAKDLNVFRWAFYKQEDVLRDKYDELYAHYGVPQGQLQHEMRADDETRLSTLLRLNEIHQQLGGPEAIKGPSPVRSDSNKFGNDNNLANLLKAGNPLLYNPQDVLEATNHALKELNIDPSAPLDAASLRREIEKGAKELDEKFRDDLVQKNKE